MIVSGYGNPLQYSCLDNSVDRGARSTTLHGVAELDMTEWLTHTWMDYMVCIFLCLLLLNTFCNFYPNCCMKQFNHFSCCVVFQSIDIPSLSILPLITIWIACNFWWLWIVLLWIFLYIFFAVPVHIFLAGMHLGVQQPEYKVYIYIYSIYCQSLLKWLIKIYQYVLIDSGFIWDVLLFHMFASS